MLQDALAEGEAVEMQSHGSSGHAWSAYCRPSAGSLRYFCSRRIAEKPPLRSVRQLPKVTPGEREDVMHGCLSQVLPYGRDRCAGAGRAQGSCKRSGLVEQRGSECACHSEWACHTIPEWSNELDIS